MEREWVIAVSYGELILKGKNRIRFIQDAERQVNAALAKLPTGKRMRQQGKYFVEVREEDLEEAVEAVQKVSGLVYVTPCLRVPKQWEAAVEAASELMRRKIDQLEEENPSRRHFSFKVFAHRADKSFPKKTPELCADMGGELLGRFDELSVDVHHPDIRLQLEVREDIFISTDRYPGMGGLPWGSAGRGLLLLSGGIDSPSAGYAMARRGMALGCLHFHAYPFTSPRSIEKAIRLARQMADYTGPMRIYLINLLSSYQAIKAGCRGKNMTVLSRRMMMRIGDRICDQYEYDAMITGDSLGQVASQTIQGLAAIEEAAVHPVLRPFIAMDKTDIIDIARKIGTYPISIEPYVDCCTVFAPDRPNTKPRIYDMKKDETALNIGGLVDQALSTLKLVDVRADGSIVQDLDQLFEEEG